MPKMSDQEFNDMLKKAAEQERDFFARHGFPHYKRTNLTGQMHPADKAWMEAVDYEQSLKSTSRLSMKTPLARLMFVLGWLTRGCD